MQKLHLNILAGRGYSDPGSLRWGSAGTAPETSILEAGRSHRRWPIVLVLQALAIIMRPEGWFIIINPLCPVENHPPDLHPTHTHTQEQLWPNRHLSSTMSPASLSKDVAVGLQPCVSSSPSLSATEHSLCCLSCPSHHGPLTRRPTITLFMAEFILISTCALSQRLIYRALGLGTV